MKITTLSIPELMLIEPTVYSDTRGFFFESFHQANFEKAVGKPVRFLQDNHSVSIKHVLRGLHYQIQQPQGKLVRVIYGTVFDVAVDCRQYSNTFGQWASEVLSAENKRQLWIPEGFAHGFIVISELAELLYKTTNYYAPADEHCIVWNDPSLNITWPKNIRPVLSSKDQQGKRFDETKVFT